jgi:4-diphosphocytidyl-2-C-methyl-D-erythritol kinase
VTRLRPGTTRALRALAPGKVNLCLFIGAPRADGLHPLASVVQPVTLADELTLRPAGPGATADEVVCAGVEGPNLAAAALSAFRDATGWDAPPQRLEIRKRVPVAAGMGGGSGDAAAALRLAAAAAGGEMPDGLLHDLAVKLGADVPSQVQPRRVLMLGAGERVEPLPEPAPFGLVIVPLDAALATPAVYAAFDERAQPRSAQELDALTARLRGGPLPDALVHNDLEEPARALCPLIGPALAAVRAAGAARALVSGSGPTVFGLYDEPGEAAEAAGALAVDFPRAIAAAPAGPELGEVTEA